MALDTHREGGLVRVCCSHPRELLGIEIARDHSVTELSVVESVVEEVPGDMQGRVVGLQSLLDRFPSLRNLRIISHVLRGTLHHENVENALFGGAASFEELQMPALKTLSLQVAGDEHGVAAPFENYDWLLETRSLPALESLDLRGLDVEIFKSDPPFLVRWSEAVILPQLRELGLPGEPMKLSHLKKHMGSFRHLDLLAVARLRSATDKNPIGGNLVLESEFADVPLSRLRATIDALPRLAELVPAMNDEAFAARLLALASTATRYDERPLGTMIARFCKRGQWHRVEELLAFAKTKSPHRRAFMNVREKTQESVASSLAKKPDAEGQRLHDELEEENRI